MMFDDCYEDYEECAFTIDELKNLAKEYLEVFFNKYGVEVESGKIYTERNISLVLNLDITSGIPIVYEAMDSIQEFKMKKKGKMPPDVGFILQSLRNCASLCIPKSFATGIIAVYLEVCKDCKLQYA